MAKNKEKSRILFDVEAKLKEEFVTRILNYNEMPEIENDRISMTKFLKAAIYKYLFMTNEEMKEFVDQGFGDYSFYKEHMQEFKNDLIGDYLPKSFGIGFPRMKDIFLIIHDIIENELSEFEIRKRVDQIYWEEWLKTDEGTKYMFNLMKNNSEINTEEVKNKTKEKWFK